MTDAELGWSLDTLKTASFVVVAHDFDPEAPSLASDSVAEIVPSLSLRSWFGQLIF